jgi:hypothetical protein
MWYEQLSNTSTEYERIKEEKMVNARRRELMK